MRITKTTKPQKLKQIKTPKGKYDMEEIQRQVNKYIDKNYVFLGYEKFVHIITKIEEMVLKRNPETRRKKGAELNRIRRNLVNKKIQELFSDSLIIIDEAHNITAKDEGFKKSKAQVEIKEEINDEIVFVKKNTDIINIFKFIYEFFLLSIPLKRIHPSLVNENHIDNFVFSTKKKNKNSIDPRFEKLKKL